MDYTKIIYDKNDILDDFSEKFKVSYKDRYDVQNLFWLKQKVKVAENNEEKKEALVLDLREKSKASNSRYKLLFAPVIDYLEGLYSAEYEKIMEAIDIIKEYGEKTIEYINRKRFTVTVPQISEMLDLTDDYINRNITDFLDKFTINNTARYAIKILYPGTYDVDFINKKVFISRKSFSDFLLEHLKFTVYRKQINLNMPKDKKEKLDIKFKTDKTLRMAFKKAVAQVNTSEKLLEELKNSSGEEIKITRNDLPVIDINEKIVESIFGADMILRSESAIRKETQDKARAEINALGDLGKEYVYKSINPKQVYDYIDNKITSIRLKFVGLNKYNRSLDKDEDKVIVRYVVDISNIVNIYVNKTVEGKEDYLYSLDLEVYAHITKGAKTEEEEQDKIIDYFYNMLMKESFTVYKKKGK